MTTKKKKTSHVLGQTENRQTRKKSKSSKSVSGHQYTFSNDETKFDKVIKLTT